MTELEMTEYPENVLRAAEKSVLKHPNDLDKAIEQCEKSVRRLKTFDSLVDFLIHKALQDLVYEKRHTMNVSMKRAASEYGGLGKVISGHSEGLARAARSVYLYHIGGSTLGALTGDQLEQIATDEQMIADGHLFNANLCLKLQPLVKKGKTVKDCVNEKKLNAIFVGLEK